MARWQQTLKNQVWALAMAFPLSAYALSGTPAHFEMTLPLGWYPAPEMGNMPYVFRGPEIAGSFPTLSVNYFSANAPQFGVESPTKTYDEYVAGRKEWLARYDGTPVAFFPMEHLESAQSSIEILGMGYRYRARQQEYVEHTYFVKCRGKLFILGSLISAAQEQEIKMVSDIKQAIRSFTCD